MALALHSIELRQMADAIIKIASLGMAFPFSTTFELNTGNVT
jgi:hypothetical protein